MSAIEYKIKGNIAYLTLNRPAVHNAINLEMVASLKNACLLISQQDNIRAVIITGAGDSFCSGEDTDSLSPDLAEELVINSNVSATVGNLEVPVIAAINGNSLGAGLALALACDVRIASEKSLFGVPDVERGYLSASGITQWLPRIVGRAKALEMILTSESMDAQEAHRIGLIHRVVSHQDVLNEANDLAQRIESKAPIALKYIKEAVSKGMDMTLPQGLRLECDLYMILHTTQDRTEGITAFREKRRPQFKGR